MWFRAPKIATVTYNAEKKISNLRLKKKLDKMHAKMVGFFQRFRITRDSDSNLTSYVILSKLCILLVSRFSVVIIGPNRVKKNKCFEMFKFICFI